MARSWIACFVGLAAASASQLPAQSAAIERCGLRIPSSESKGYAGLPSGDVFCPLMADPKGLHSFLSYQRTVGEDDSLSTIGSVGIADQFGIARWNGSTPGNGVQLSISGGVFAQFDLGAPSLDLLNADYVVGIPLTIRRDAFSMRLRIYHQSSHLGDEFLLRTTDSGRVNLSFEAAEAIVSVEGPLLRLYGGGELLFHKSPDDLERLVAHGGAELRPLTSAISLGSAGGVRPVAAIDLKSSQEQDWKPSISIRAGIEFERTRGADPPSRRWSLLLESYRGPSPYGQFFAEKIQYFGLGAHFQL